jgi:hypothetical protein
MTSHFESLKFDNENGVQSNGPQSTITQLTQISNCKVSFHGERLFSESMIK